MKRLANLFVKRFIKLFIPSSAKLSGYAADKIADGVNKCGKAETIAKYSQMVKVITAHAADVNAMLLDGKIDGDENAKIREMLTPLFDSVLKLI